MGQGQRVAAFRMETIKPKEGNRQLAEPIREVAKLKYGRRKMVVEAEIRERARIS